jgi:uncharacterized protein YqeY
MSAAMSEPLKSRLSADMKAALRAGDKARLGAIRLMLAAIKQREIDNRSELDEAQALAVLDKMVKQRRESIVQYESARREDLVAIEQFELEVIREYMPAMLSDVEIDRLIDAAQTQTGASGLQDMGKLMAHLKRQLQGRADMAAVSSRVKARLSGR